jgi:hypothetical protein
MTPPLPKLTSWITSSLLFLTSSVPAFPQNAPSSPQNNTVPSQAFKIAGTVVNAVTNVPLSRVRVSLASTRVRAQRIETLTDESGHFEFSGVPPGKYSLQGAKRGYVTSGFEQHEQYSTAIVTGPQFTTDKLVFRLMPLALIIGHILDESGEGVRRARVRLFMADHSGGMSRVVPAEQSSTDDRGYFDFSLLRPGTYFISTEASPWYAVHPAAGQSGDAARVSPGLDVAYPTTYYGGATDSEAATPVEIKGGQIQDVELRLTPVPALHFTLRVPVQDGQQSVFQHPVILKRVFDSVEVQAFAEVQYGSSPGAVEVTGLAPGRYDVNIRSSNPTDPQQFNEIDLQHDGQDLSATDSETLTKLTIKLRNNGLPKQYAIGLRDSHQKMALFATGDLNGQVTFPAVRSGKYTMVVPAQGKAYAVKRIVSPTGETEGHDLVVSSGAMEVTAELTEGLVTIDGVVSKAGKPVPGIMVALVPNDPEAHIEYFRRDQSDFDGTFSLPGVLQGTYTVVAVEDAWGFDWLKTGVLAKYVQHGQTVIIGEKLRGSVHLPDPVEVQPK